ncbi:MAG: DUF2608 domain-containing protein [Gammaproteobacteria bacterium]|nr:DUF2608 domain-containing protein [Gammaproteobacteria bacterium]
MKKILSFVTSTALLFMLTNTFADSKIISTDSFATVKQLIEQNKHPHHLLLALDDDDTLTMMPCPSPSHCQYLGGPAWYNWQSKLPAGDTDRVWQTFPQLLAINNLLMVMSQMPLVDPQTPSTLQAADNRGAFIVVASARGSDMSNATETQFQQDGIFNLIKQAAIKTPTGHTSFPGEYLPDSWQETPVRLIQFFG